MTHKEIYNTIFVTDHEYIKEHEPRALFFYEELQPASGWFENLESVYCSELGFIAWSRYIDCGMKE